MGLLPQRIRGRPSEILGMSFLFYFCVLSTALMCRPKSSGVGPLQVPPKQTHKYPWYFGVSLGYLEGVKGPSLTSGIVRHVSARAHTESSSRLVWAPSSNTDIQPAPPPHILASHRGGRAALVALRSPAALGAPPRNTPAPPRSRGPSPPTGGARAGLEPPARV